jgi:hypothetical protein
LQTDEAGKEVFFGHDRLAKLLKALPNAGSWKCWLDGSPPAK